MSELKERIIKDLEFGIPATYRRYGLSLNDFLLILTEMQNEGIITFDIYHNILPNGNPHPHHGDPINIRLRK